MKPSTTLSLTVCAGAAAFLLGRWNAGAGAGRENGPAAMETRAPSARTRASDASARSGSLAVCERVSPEKVALLSSVERMRLLADGALIYNSANQAAVLCGVISALTKEEIQEAMNILGGIQDRGNYQTQEVWDGLWKQWGRVDPMACLANFGVDAVSKSRADARNVMTGWLETDPAAALAWAKEPKHAPLEAAAAALAITSQAHGGLKQLESAILALPADGLTANECLQDYFDLASLAGKAQSPETIYQQIPAALRPAAWSVTARRIGYGDSAVAKAWVSQHAADPGRDYDGISNLLHTLTYEDPAGTARWAAQLPYSAASDRSHPAARPVAKWMEQDPVAAAAWAKTQPPDAPWVPPASR